MKDDQCPKCGSKEVMAGVKVSVTAVADPSLNARYQPLRARVEEPEPAKHGLIWIQKQESGIMQAWICAACGYTELYTDNLADLYKMYKQSQP